MLPLDRPGNVLVAATELGFVPHRCYYKWARELVPGLRPPVSRS